jgi:hypothetical protein
MAEFSLVLPSSSPVERAGKGAAKGKRANASPSALPSHPDTPLPDGMGASGEKALSSSSSTTSPNAAPKNGNNASSKPKSANQQHPAPVPKSVVERLKCALGVEEIFPDVDDFDIPATFHVFQPSSPLLYVVGLFFKKKFN